MQLNQAVFNFSLRNIHLLYFSCLSTRSLTGHFFLVLSNIASSGGTAAYWSILLLKYILAASRFWWSWLKLLCISTWGFPGGSAVKNPPANAGNMGSIPGLGSGNPLQHSCLGNPMDGRGWQATVHGVTESNTADWLRTHTHTHIVWIIFNWRSIIDIRVYSVLYSFESLVEWIITCIHQTNSI